MFRQSIVKDARTVALQTAIFTAMLLGAVALTPAHADPQRGVAVGDGTYSGGYAHGSSKTEVWGKVPGSKPATSRPNPPRIDSHSWSDRNGRTGGQNGRGGLGERQSQLDAQQPMVFALLDVAGEVMTELFGVAPAYAERGDNSPDSNQPGSHGQRGDRGAGRGLGSWGGVAGAIAGSGFGPYGIIGGAIVGRAVGLALERNSSQRSQMTGRAATAPGGHLW